jgi:hypothetical protein
MRSAVLSVAAGLLSFLVACGPAGRRLDDDDGTGDVDASPIGGPEICNDAYDNDGDGRADCSDTDCSGVGNCPVCGSVENPQATPLALPDGISSGAACSTDADCSGGTPNCVQSECHASYTSTLKFIGFAPGATLTDPNLLLNVCVDIEHSWLRDLQIELITPPDAGGQKHVVVLDKWHDRTTLEEIFLGMANDSDDAANPVPGTGAKYCWTATASVPMIDASGVAGPTTAVGLDRMLTPGDYKSMSPWTTMTGVTLNGDWTMRVTDLWGEDNGFMFKWSIKFDPSLVSDCSGPIIL